MTVMLTYSVILCQIINEKDSQHSLMCDSSPLKVAWPWILILYCFNVYSMFHVSIYYYKAYNKFIL